MDTMTVTKAVAAFCGAFLVFLLAKWAAEGIYHPGGHAEQAYIIETQDEGGAGGAEAGADAESLDVAALVSEADPGKGEKIFKKCHACHKVEPGANAVGPTLHAVVGRPVASEAGFNYSEALKGLGGDWTPERLFHFLHSPKDFAPGTAMGFAGLKKQSDLANVIAYLETLSD